MITFEPPIGYKKRATRVLPIIVVDDLTDHINVDRELKQYNIDKPIEVYTISKDYGVWTLRHGKTRQSIPCSNAREMVLWLKNELENPESEMIPTPGKGCYRPVLCLFGALLDEHLPTFHDGRTGKMLILTDLEGPSIPEGRSIHLRQFYRNVDDGSYGPYHDKVVFSNDGKITIEGCEADYTPGLGLAVAACLSTGNCTLVGTV